MLMIHPAFAYNIDGDDGDDDLIWGEFDQRASVNITRTNPLSAAVMEVRSYVEEPNIRRQDDPLAWWKTDPKAAEFKPAPPKKFGKPNLSRFEKCG